MSPQLTLQTPLQLPPTEIPTYLEQLWSHDERGDKGANTFCLIVWQPAWIEQKLVKTGQISGPIVGNQRNDLIEAAREIIVDLPVGWWLASMAPASTGRKPLPSHASISPNPP